MNDIRKKFHLNRIHDNWTLNTCVWQFGKCRHGTDNAWDSETNVAKRKFYLDGKHLTHFSNETIASIAISSVQDVEAKFGYRIFMDKELAETAYNKHTRCAIHWPEGYLWSQRKLCSSFVVVRRIFWWNMEKIIFQMKRKWTLVLNLGKRFLRPAQPGF